MDNQRITKTFPGMTLAQLKISAKKEVTEDFTVGRKSAIINEIARREAPGFTHFKTPQVSW